VARLQRCCLAALTIAAALGLVLLVQRAVAAQEDPGHGPGSIPPDGPGIQVGEPAPPQEVVDRGEELFITGCSTCHGIDGEGVVDEEGDERGPAVANSGAAAAYYYLSTGRMPLDSSRTQPVRKPPAYDPDDIEAIVAYIDSLGVGPDIPAIDIENLSDDDLSEGGALFRANCAPCHSAAGVGGALSYGQAAPSLADSEPLQVATAMRAGPGEMPVFGREISDEDLNRIVAYVQYLRNPDDPGGVPIGRVGPIPEGFVAWVVGIGSLLLAVYWIGSRHGRRSRATAMEAR
jgi:ubiquinol-cytochrome c reductase cytochrome c subunit